MGSAGAVVMGFFGAVFCVFGLGPIIGYTNPILILPIVIFGSIVAIVMALARKGTANLRTARAGKAIMWSTIGEGIGIFIALNLCINFGHADLILPAIAIVVGIHFLPLAYAIPFRAFYALAAALIVAAIVGFLLHQPTGSAIAGVASAAALWTASFLALRRQSRALSLSSR